MRTEANERSGQTKTSKNRIMKYIELADTLKIQKELFRHIVHEYLGTRKLTINSELMILHWLKLFSHIFVEYMIIDSHPSRLHSMKFKTWKGATTDKVMTSTWDWDGTWDGNFFKDYLEEKDEIAERF